MKRFLMALFLYVFMWVYLVCRAVDDQVRRLWRKIRALFSRLLR